MNDKILLVNDLPGYGKVALSAMFPVMSHMGFDVYNLPTAVVSNTLDYGKFHILDTTDHMEKSISVWDELGFTFDAICTGFILTEKQVKIVLDYCKNHMKSGSTLYVDPIMGDEGKLYAGVGEETIKNMRGICSRADLIVPNFTEAAFLTGMYCDRERVTRNEAEKLIAELRKMGSKSIVITSVFAEDGYLVSCYDDKTGELFHVPFDHIDVRFVGTGDIFSAVLYGKMLRGEPLKKSVIYTVNVMHRLISENMDTKDRFKGIPLEKNLNILDEEWEKLS